MRFNSSPSCYGRICFSFAPQKKDSKFSYPVPASTIDKSMGCGGGGVVVDSGPARDSGDSVLSTQIAMQSLWNIKVAVLVKPEHENRISHVSTSSVKTGIANTLGEQSGPPASSPAQDLPLLGDLSFSIYRTV